MKPTPRRTASAALRLLAALMVIPIGACDNVEWGGVDLSVVPPPPRAEPVEAGVRPGERLPESPILYYVARDARGGTIIPVAEILDSGLAPINMGEDPDAYGSRFIAAFLRRDAEFTLFHRGRRAGTLIVDSAAVPAGNVCRRVPRARGRLELGGSAAGAAEFLAMARPQAPAGIVLPGDTLAVERRMQVVGNILAERTLRVRNAPLPNWATARRQLFPFPLSETRDLAFTATFLMDDELQVGNDDVGHSLFIVYTPQAQVGYDTAFVSYTDYSRGGKAAPRAIDFLDWNRDGTPELLLEVFGARNSWFEAVGSVDGVWRRLLEDRCDPGAVMAPDTAAADTLPGDTAPGGEAGSRPAPG